MRYYDNTRISTYRECPRKFLFRHMFDLVPDGTAIALIYGLAWHEAMNVVWPMVNSKKHSDETVLKAAMMAWRATWIREGMPEPENMDMARLDALQPRTPGNAAEMVYNYILERKMFIQSCELLANERPYAVDVFGDSTAIKYIGRLDKVVKHPEYGVLVIEHKTTSAYAKEGGFRRDFLLSWSPDSQIDGYGHSGHMLYGNECKGVWVDAALVHKTVHNKFKFIPVDRSFAALDQWLLETRDWIKRIEDERERFEKLNGSDSYVGFPKNTGSCNNYSGCPYRDLCKFVPKPLDVQSNHNGYKVEKWEPFDVLKIEELGLERENG